MRSKSGEGKGQESGHIEQRVPKEGRRNSLDALNNQNS